MLNGDLDPQTPIWVGGELKDRFTGPFQTFLTVPRAAHCVIGQTPVAEEGARSCGMKIFLEFLRDPRAAPDTSCFAEIPEERFTGDSEWNAYLLGTTDLWENDAPRAHAISALSPARERKLRQVRRRARELLR